MAVMTAADKPRSIPPAVKSLTSSSPFSSCFLSGIDSRCVSVLVRKEFLIDAKICPHFRRIWTHVQELCLGNEPDSVPVAVMNIVHNLLYRPCERRPGRNGGVSS